VLPPRLLLERPREVQAQVFVDHLGGVPAGSHRDAGAGVGAGRIDGDGQADIITGAGAGGGPHVKAFSGANGSLLRSFIGYDPAFTGGVSVSSEDVDGDGRADIITGAGTGGGPHVRIFS